MTDDVKAALDYFETPEREFSWDEAPAHGCALARELRRREGETCDSCEHSFVGMAPAGRPHFRYCKLTKQGAEGFTAFYVECATLGNTCGAWQKRGGA